MTERRPDATNKESRLKPEELKAFLSKVYVLDQSTPDRIDAKECYEKLKAKESSFVGSEYEEDYYHSLSFELFHVLQSKLLNNHETSEAVKLLDEAISFSKKGWDTEWTNYLEGTASYLNNDPRKLKEHILPDKLNTEVLQRLFNGLESRGFPDYRLDY